MSSFTKYAWLKWIRNVIYVGFCFLVLLFLFLLVLAVYVFSVSYFSGEVIANERDATLYEYYKLDRKNNRSSVGFVTSYEYLEGDNYISYEDSAGDFVLISNFGSQRYECTGKCVCEELDRRQFSVPLVKGLTHLVVAVSSLYALSLAWTHFEELCKNDFVDECPLNAIRADVEDCESLIPEVLDEEGEVIVTKENTPERNNFKGFECVGFCMSMSYYRDGKIYSANNENLHSIGGLKPNEHQIAQFEKFQKYADGFGCHEIKLTQIMNLEFTPEVLQSIDELPFGIVKKYQIAAKWKFLSDVLHPFCIASGLKRIVPDDNSVKSMFAYMNEEPEFPMCCGHADYQNPTAHCIETLIE